MIQNENQLTSLPFYSAERFQDRFKWWVENLYKLVSPINKFLPFQIVKEPTPPQGPAQCPVPATINYEADFENTGLDGWEVSVDARVGALVTTIDIVNTSLHVQTRTSGSGGVVKFRKFFSATAYKYSATDLEFNFNVFGAGASSNLLLKVEAGSVFQDYGSGVSLNASTRSYSATFTSSKDYIEITTFLAPNSDIYLISVLLEAIPATLLEPSIVYQGSPFLTVDGWSVEGGGTLQVGENSPGVGTGNLFPGGNITQVKKSFNIDIEDKPKIKITVNGADNGDTPEAYTLGLSLIFRRKSGGNVLVNIAEDFAHEFALTDFPLIQIADNDDYDRLLEVGINWTATNGANEFISEIDIEVSPECEEPVTDIWTNATLINAETAAETDITTYMNAETTTSDYEDSGGYQVAIYPALNALAADLNPGYYYIKLEDGVGEYFSEVFNPCSNLDSYVKIEWWRDIDIIYNGGRIVYSGGFINTLYLDADIGKPTHEYEIEQTVRDGYKFKEKVVSLKRFKILNVLIAEVVSDLLSRLPHHEYITVFSEGITYQVIDIEIPEPDWEEVGDLAQLPIEFETDTIISTGTSVVQNYNQLLSDPTDAINIRGNNKRIFQLGDPPTTAGLFIPADKQSNSEAVKIPIEDLENNAENIGTGAEVFSGVEDSKIQLRTITGINGITATVNGDEIDISVEEDITTKENLSTGISFGGELSINGGDNTKFDITAGEAVFIDSFTDPENPTFVTVTWVNQTAVTVTNIATQLVTYVVLESNGTFTQQAAGITSSEARTRVEIGLVVHADLATVQKTTNLNNWNRDTDLKTLDLANSLGRINISGNAYSPNGTNLKIDRSAGVTYAINGNYGINKQNPNIVTTSADTEVLTYRVYGGTPAVVGVSTDIDTTQYDPLGAGTLVPIPADAVTTHGIFFSPETGVTAVHYGQFLYDSLREAVDSWEKEEYNVIAELKDVPVMGVLAFVAGATDLSDPMQAKFITPGAFGIKNATRVPEYSRYASYDKTIAGMTYKRPDVDILEDTGTIYAEVERLGGGDLIFVFGEREYVLDCTTGTGTGGKARVALTAGTATAPQENYIYATPTTGNGHAQLNASTSYPTGEFAFIADCAIQDSVSFVTNKSLGSRRWTDAKEFDGRSSIARTNEWIRRQPATWESGVLQTVTIDTVPSPDSVVFSNTAGLIWQKHRQDFPALDISVDAIYIANHPTTPYVKITDLNDALALVTSDGTSMSDTRFNWVIWGAQNKSTGECKLYLNLPVDTYALNQSAVDDPNNTAVVTVPEWARGKAFLIARMPMRHRTQSGGTYENLALSIRGTDVIDLRGILANVTGGATSPPLVNSFEDALFNIYNVLAGFNTRFDASNLTANRILSFPDSSGTLALKSDIIDVIQLAVSDEITDLIIGSAKITFRMPYAFTLTEVRASVGEAPTGSTLIVDINENGTTILSTKLSIDAGEKTSTTAVTPPVISDADLADDSEITIDIDQVGSTTAGKGLKVTLIGTR